MSIKVSDVMGRVAIAVRQDARFADIVFMMKRYAVGAVTVIDSDRRPIGVVSEDDLLLKAVGDARRRTSIFEGITRRHEHQKAAGVIAAELMTSPAITVTPGTPARDAARLMHDKRIKQLPVIDPVTGRITGTVHQSDLLRVFDRSSDGLRAEVDSVVRDVARMDPADLSIKVDCGVVTIGGKVEHRSDAQSLVDAIRGLDGVIDVNSELTYGKSDPAVVPPLY